MPTRAVAAAERSALCDTLLAVGPDAPTLCTPWLTRDLAAHLVLREHRPDLIVTAHLPVVGDRLEREQRELASGTDWGELVERVRSGPPAWHPTQIGAVDEAVNTLEFFIHHEDVLRAAHPVRVRELSEETAQGVWTALKRTAKLLFRKVDAGLVLAAPGFGRIAVRAPSRRGSVTVTAAPGELALLGSGRGAHADYVARGSKAALKALASASLAM